MTHILVCPNEHKSWHITYLSGREIDRIALNLFIHDSSFYVIYESDIHPLQNSACFLQLFAKTTALAPIQPLSSPSIAPQNSLFIPSISVYLPQNSRPLRYKPLAAGRTSHDSIFHAATKVSAASQESCDGQMTPSVKFLRAVTAFSEVPRGSNGLQRSSSGQ